MAKINLTAEQIAERNKKISLAMAKKWRSRKRQASLKKSARKVTKTVRKKATVSRKPTTSGTFAGSYKGLNILLTIKPVK